MHIICNYVHFIGPLPNTVSHFWQMVWEQKCEIIVMLTGLIEGGKVSKIHSYNHKLPYICMFSMNS